MYVHTYQRCNQVRSSGSFGSLFVRVDLAPHVYMPDLDQNYLVIYILCTYIENCNEKIDTV